MGVMKSTDPSKKIVLFGPHRYTEEYAREVQQILEGVFGFSVDFFGSDRIKLGQFTDGETQCEISLEDLVTLNGNDVYILQDTRVYDQEDRSESNPLYLLQQVKNLIQIARDGKARHIAYATRKTSTEWTHQHDKNRKKKGKHEAYTLKDFILTLAINCVDSYIVLHPHGPRESMFSVKKYGLPYYIELHPHASDRVNGIPINLQQAIPEVELEKQLRDPFSYFLSLHRERYASETTLFVAPDIGAIPNTQDFAADHKFRYVLSISNRHGEGKKEFIQTHDAEKTLEGIVSIDPSVYLPNLESRLEELARTNPNAVVRFIILDDKINSGGTADQEAEKRINEVSAYVKKYNELYPDAKINLKAEVELWCTHMRIPDISKLRHEHISKIVIMDTTKYVPDLEFQLEKYGMREKVEILSASAYQVAMGIALDYKISHGDYRIQEKFFMRLKKKALRWLYERINPPNCFPEYVAPKPNGLAS
jgi:hypothetical protein